MSLLQRKKEGSTIRLLTMSENEQQEQPQEQQAEAPVEAPPKEDKEETKAEEAASDTPQQAQPSTSSVNLPPATGVVWRLQYVPTVVFGDGTR